MTDNDTRPMYEDVKERLAEARQLIFAVEEKLPHGDEMRRRLYRVRCDLAQEANVLLNSTLVRHRTGP